MTDDMRRAPASQSLAARWARIAASLPGELGVDSWTFVGGPYGGLYRASIMTRPDPDTFPDDTKRPRDQWKGEGKTPLQALAAAEEKFTAGRLAQPAGEERPV